MTKNNKIALTDAQIDRTWQDADSQATARYMGGDRQVQLAVLTSRIFASMLLDAPAPVMQEAIPVKPITPDCLSTELEAVAMDEDGECNGCALIRSHYKQAWNRGNAVGLAENAKEIHKTTNLLIAERAAHAQTNVALTRELMRIDNELEEVILRTVCDGKPQ